MRTARGIAIGAVVLLVSVLLPGTAPAQEAEPSTVETTTAPTTETTTTPTTTTDVVPAEPAEGAAASSNPADQMSAKRAANDVDIKGFAFKPKDLTIQAGDKVTWKNFDS